jgi:hypothetical protein
MSPIRTSRAGSASQVLQEAGLSFLCVCAILREQEGLRQDDQRKGEVTKRNFRKGHGGKLRKPPRLVSQIQPSRAIERAPDATLYLLPEADVTVSDTAVPFAAWSSACDLCCPLGLHGG